MKTVIYAFLYTVTCVVALGQTTVKLLPFQGRLTDQNGVAVSNGVRLVQFKIFEVPAGGSPVWAGELHRTTVNGGLVNVLLGSKTPFTGVDFDRQVYLDITVDINGDTQISPADPPMLPRQAILPVVFAKEAADSRKLAGYDWISIFGVNDPSGPLPGNKLQPGGITSVQLASNSVTSLQLASNSVTRAKIEPGLLAAVSGWQPVALTVAPSLSHSTAVAISAKARRVGENVEIVADLQFTGDITDQVNTGGLVLDIPYQIDFNKMVSSRLSVVGQWYHRYSSGDQISGVCIVGADAFGGARVGVVVPSYDLRPGMRYDTTSQFSVRFSVPVGGWAAAE